MQNFTTNDINTAAYLDLKGITPTLEIEEGKVSFIFPVNDNLYHFLEKFSKNASVPVGDFITCLKILRGKMLTLKECNGYGKGGKNGNGTYR